MANNLQAEHLQSPPVNVNKPSLPYAPHQGRKSASQSLGKPRLNHIEGYYSPSPPSQDESVSADMIAISNSICRPGCPRIPRSTYFYLWSAEIKDMGQHSPAPFSKREAGPENQLFSHIARDDSKTQSPVPVLTLLAASHLWSAPTSPRT